MRNVGIRVNSNTIDDFRAIIDNKERSWTETGVSKEIVNIAKSRNLTYGYREVRCFTDITLEEDQGSKVKEAEDGNNESALAINK